MALPLLPLGYAMLATGAGIGAGANLYSQAKQRELYRYQRQGYERALQDWHKNVPGRSIRYPEQSYPGHVRALDTGITQSYYSGLGTIGRAVGFSGGSVLSYQRGISNSRVRSLYNAHPVSSRWL